MNYQKNKYIHQHQWLPENSLTHCPLVPRPGAPTLRDDVWDCRPHEAHLSSWVVLVLAGSASYSLHCCSTMSTEETGCPWTCPAHCRYTCAPLRIHVPERKFWCTTAFEMLGHKVSVLTMSRYCQFPKCCTHSHPISRAWAPTTSQLCQVDFSHC